MKVIVKVSQKLQGHAYPDEVVANFNDYEEASLFAGVVLHACEDARVEIEKVEEVAGCLDE